MEAAARFSFPVVTLSVPSGVKGEILKNLEGGKARQMTAQAPPATEPPQLVGLNPQTPYGGPK